MNNLYEWQNINNQIKQMTKTLSVTSKSKINDKIFKKANEILTEKSLGLIYDKYGEQLYEKTPNVLNYLTCKKSGFQTIIMKDDSKLIPTKFKKDKFNTDFISYGSLPNIEQEDVKNNLNINNDFVSNNNYLYKFREQEEKKYIALTEGIDEIKNWFNTFGQQEFQKIDSSFVGKIK